MPIKWKDRFKQDVILSLIDKSRTQSPDGGVAFAGLGLQEQMPILSSMLHFPEAAARLNKTALVWRALIDSEAPVDSSSFLKAINRVLNRELSAAIKPYVFATSISVDRKGVPRSIKVLQTTIIFPHEGFSRKIKFARQWMPTIPPIPKTPEYYLPTLAKVKDKSPQYAALQAIDHIDLLRGLIALHTNFAMQIALGGNAFLEPVNVVRCGGIHTIHRPSGDVAAETVWFETNFRPANLYEIKHPAQVFKSIRLSLRRISSASYQAKLSGALIRAARALDEPDSSTAFVKLWSALESVITTERADYKKLVQRCASLYQNFDYHEQVLEHLREFRNESVHSGIETDNARINCFLLQGYFRTVIHFFISNATEFQSLSAAHEFLDLLNNRDTLRHKAGLLRKAMRFSDSK